MSQSDLPPECSQALDYVSLIETLKLLDSEEVCMFIAAGTDDGKSSRIQAVGVLKHYAYGWGEAFAVGDGARVLIWEPDFVSAHLQTFDGVDYFRIGIELVALRFVVGDLALQTDEFDLLP
jgi:hypothetical protein